MDVKLPNGNVIRGVPEGTPKEQIQAKAIASGLATEQDFSSAVNFADTKTATQNLAAEQSAMDAALISAGRGINTIGSAVERLTGFDIPGIEQEQGVVKQAMQDLGEEYPITTAVGETVGETLPFLPAGLASGGLASNAGRIATTAGLGALEGGASQYGKGESVADSVGAAGAGGVIAGTMEAALPVIGRGIGKIYRRLAGSSRAPLDRAGMNAAMKELGLGPEDLSDDAIAMLDVLPENADPIQALRAAKFRELGLEPTRAQITRNAADFQTQQEAAKTSGRIRDALERQEGQISNLFDDYGRATGGNVSQEGNSVIDTIINRQTLRDERIGQLYNAAREAAPTSKNINLQSFVETLRKSAPQNELTGGLVKAIRGDLQQRGVLGKGFKRQGLIDVSTAEDIRKTINQFYNSTNDFGRIKIRELKDALDDDVLKTAGGDIYKEARAAKAQFESELRRAKVSKFDARKQNLVRDVLENKINPDTLVNDTAFSKKWRAEDIQQLKDFTIGSGEGMQAWNDYRAEVLQGIRDMAFTGPVDNQGYQAISRAGLERAVDKIGKPKLKAIFNADELKFLRDLKQITAMREPVRGTALGRGPSAQAISKLEEYVRTVPLAGALIGDITDVNGRLALRSSPDVIIKPIPQLNQAAAAAGLATTSAALNNEDER